MARIFPVGVQWLPDCHVNIPRGVLPCKSDGGAGRKISRALLKGTRILFYGRVPNSFSPLRGTNSTATNYITDTADFNSNTDNFRRLSSQWLFESFVINLTETTLAAVILGFSTLSGNSPQIKTLKRYDEHPHHFSRGVNPLPPGDIRAVSVRKSGFSFPKSASMEGWRRLRNVYIDKSSGERDRTRYRYKPYFSLYKSFWRKYVRWYTRKF